MDIRRKSNFHNINSNKAYISTELANLIYDKVKKNQVLGLATIHHELCKLKIKYLQVEELDKVQEPLLNIINT